MRGTSYVHYRNDSHSWSHFDDYHKNTIKVVLSQKTASTVNGTQVQFTPPPTPLMSQNSHYKTKPGDTYMYMYLPMLSVAIPLLTLHYITIFYGGLSKNFKDHRAQQATQATIQCPDNIAETNESSVFVGTPVKTAQM